MSTAIITRTYQDHAISYNGEGWFNATEAAAKFDKRLDHWLNNKETKEYIAVLAEDSNTPLSGYLKTKRGNNGGTWLHPKLAVVFARWLDVRFAVWCDSQIDSIIRSKDDWRKLRHAASSSTKVQDAMLLHVRQAIGKATEAKHWMNEHKLINSLLTGEYKGLHRDSLSQYELDFLAHFELRNAVLLGIGLSYEQRKGALKAEAIEWQHKKELQHETRSLPSS